MISTSDFKKGLRFELEDAPWQILEQSVHNPSARGAATLVKVKVRNLVTGQVLQKSFKAGEMFDEPDLSRLKVQFLYEEGEDIVFMDQDTFEQYHVPKEKLGDSLSWLTEELTINLLRYNGEVIQVELPSNIVAVVSTVEGGARGDTAAGKVMSKAMLENGVEVQVPTFIKEGNKVKIDPSTNTYLGREN